MTKAKEFDDKPIIFSLIVIILLLVLVVLIRSSHASYESNVDVTFGSQTALFVYGVGTLTFNMDPVGVIPAGTANVYPFTISNFSNDRHSDVDIDYHIRIRTTTNLPFTYELLYDEDYSASRTNILTNEQLIQDAQGTWYRTYEVSDPYRMLWNEDHTDNFNLVVNFPVSNATHTEYAGGIENIEIIIDAVQVL